MKTLKYIMVFALALTAEHSLSQQDPQFTQYFDQMLLVNPAYAGSNDMLSITGIHREQWVGFDGRPRSSAISVHSPVGKNVGLGLTAVNDQLGPLNQTSIYGDFSYTLRFGKNKNTKSSSKLSFGVKGGINIINLRTSELSVPNQGDPSLMNNVVNSILPNVGAGIYYHNPKFFVGVSSPKILEESYGTIAGAEQLRHYFFMMGGVMKINPTWNFRPTTQVKLTPGAPLSIDLSATFIYDDQWWLGVMNRWGDSFGAFVQFQLTDQFKAGLAYDHTISELTSHNRGTFEVLLNYDFRFNKNGVRTPRYF